MDIRNTFWDDLTEIYHHVLQSECLCYANSRKHITKMLDEIFFIQSSQNLLRKKEIHELQLLSLSVVNLSSKIYLLHGGAQYCENIITVIKHVISDPFLDSQVHYLMDDGNKFVHRAILRNLALLLYVLDENKLYDRVQKLINSLKSSISLKSSVNLLNLFELLMEFSLKSVHVLESHNVRCPAGEKMTCKKQTQLSCIPVDDLKFHCCSLLCDNWAHLVKKNFRIKCSADENEVFIAFLCLWRSSLKATTMSKERALDVLFNIEQLIALFVSSTPTQPTSLKMFLEVLIQALSVEDSFIACDSKQKELERGGGLLVGAINSGFLENLPVENTKYGFGGIDALEKSKAIWRPSQELCDKIPASCDEIAIKKIVYVVLKILSASKVSHRLLAAFFNTEAYVKGKMHLTSDVPAHSWILDLFFDQDDLLIAALLSSFYLYVNMEFDAGTSGVPSEDVIRLKTSLNPHKTFIKFLQRIAGDHHVILDFLVSSETCMLAYLMKYLKVVLSEWELFLSAHESEAREKQGSEDAFGIDDRFISVGAASNPSIEEDCSVLTCTDITAGKSEQAHLVSYSSSSSSSSDLESFPSPNYRFLQDSRVRQETVTSDWTISVLVKLRQALEKLVECQEFPYRVDRLTELLRQCEIMNST